MLKRKKDIKINIDEFISAAKLHENWGLVVPTAKQVRAVVKVETNEGTYALKKVDHKPEKLNFIYEAQEYLWKNGFQHQPRWLITKSGQPYVQTDDGAFYFLNKWIDGVESNIREPDQLKEIMKLQAILHKASLGFIPSSNAMMKTKWEHWITDYDSDVEEMKTYYNKIKQEPSSDLVLAFLETAEPMIKMAEVGLKLLKASPYEKVLDRARYEKGFIHGDFAYHNFIRSKDGEMHVIDFDYCSQNLRIHDFAHFFRKVMRRADWDVDLNHNMLQAYHEVNPLRQDELEVLKAMMHLPKRYWRIVKRGFVTKRYTPEETIKEMRKEAVQLDKWKKYLDSFPTKL